MLAVAVTPEQTALLVVRMEQAPTYSVVAGFPGERQAADEAM